MSIDASFRKDVRILAQNQAAWTQTLAPDPRRSQVDQRAWQETHALKISCQAPMMRNQNVRQVVVFNGVVGAVGSSGNCANKTAVAASLAFGSMVDSYPEFTMERLCFQRHFTGISKLGTCLIVLAHPESKSRQYDKIAN